MNVAKAKTNVAEVEMNLAEVSKKAREAVKEILNTEPEGLSAIEKSDGGWRVEAEVLERKAVPNKFDLLKVFEFKLDANCKVQSFKLLKKKHRGDLD